MEEQLRQLKEELAAMRDQFTLKTMLLSKKIQALEQELLASGTPNASNNDSSEPTHPPSQALAASINNIIKDPVDLLLNETAPNNTIEAAEQKLSNDDADFSVTSNINDKNQHNDDPWRAIASKPSTPHKPPFINVIFTHLMALMFEWFSPLVKIYESYKARGMLGIFLLTVAGAALVLAGFGYLMQLLIAEIGAGSKSLLMSATAISVIGGGVLLKVKTTFSEFASAIVALGLLLCFSTIYFVGSVYQLIPGLALLALYALTALACHYLALWLDTKVIAVLGSVGIAVMPLLTGSTIIEPAYYVLALLFVSASSLYLAYKHIGHWLAELSFAFTFIALAWINSDNALFMSAWMINAFYVLFSGYLYLSLFQHKPQTKRFLIFLAAVVGASLLLLLQGADYSVSELNLQLALNAVIGLVAALLFYKVKHEQLSVLVLITATWIVLSIVGMLAATYWGIAWAIEAILLIFMSRYYNIPSLIHQGQGLAALAIVYCLFAVIPYFPLPALLNTDAWVIVIMIAVVISIWQRLIRPAKTKQTDSVIYHPYVQAQVYPALIFLESAWLSIVALACAYVWLGEWAGLSAILIQLALLFRAKNVSSTALNKTSIEMLAIILILFPIAYAFVGSEAVNSIRFSQLPVFAKASLIVAFVQLWLWSAFYRKFNPESRLRNMAELARILFYLLLPICWLGTAFRRLDEDILMVLWLSPVIAILLAHFSKAKPLLYESKILFAAFSLLSLWFMLFSSLTTAVMGLAGYAVVVSLAYYLNKKPQSDVKFNFVLSWALNLAGILIAVFFATHFNDGVLPIVIISFYSLAVIGAHQRFLLCNENKGIHFGFLVIASISSWLLMLFGAASKSNTPTEYAITPLLILAIVFFLKKRQMLPIDNKVAQDSTKLELYMHTYLLITYVLSCLTLYKFGFDLAIAPLLAMHGAIILFVKNRSRTTVRYSFALILMGIAKLALIDTANVVLWQKVIMFMGIGVFILLCSFWYQKLVSKDAEALKPAE